MQHTQCYPHTGLLTTNCTSCGKGGVEEKAAEKAASDSTRQEVNEKSDIQHTAYRAGGWLPVQGETLHSFLNAQKIDYDEPLCPEVQKLYDLIKENIDMRLLATEMINNVPSKYQHNPSGGPRVQSIKHMVYLINSIIKTPPIFHKQKLVALPMDAILDWSMGTHAGAVFFLNEQVNRVFKEILDKWRHFLSSPESLVAFSPDQWMSEDVMKMIGIEQFVHEPDSPAWGFKSWNDFFIRKFKKGQRPIAEPENHRIITSACESTPFSIQHHVKGKDTFWIKWQPYSLEEVLVGRYVDKFVGGTIFQGFLSPFNYHRWHAPISGTIMHTEVIPGSYFAESPAEHFDPNGPNLSQGYLAHVATRGLIFIEAKNEDIGWVVVVTIGVAEVSSSVITVKKGEEVEKGDQLGYFQYGGSSHCVIFQENVIDSFAVEAMPCPHVQLMTVKSKLATVRERKVSRRNE